MRKLITITFLMMLTVTAYALDKTYYGHPTIKRMRDAGRIQMYDNLSGTRNITGKIIRRDTLGGNSDINTGAYGRVMEVKDTSGTTIYYVQNNGKMTIGGQPEPLTVSSIYPANGATGQTNADLRYINSPAVGFNKGDQPTVTMSPTSSTASYSMGVFSNFSGAIGTTYTMSFNRSTYVQTDGEITSSCGVMTDAAGVCSSTFVMQ